MLPTLTERRSIGTTSLDLPILGLGTAPLGELYAVLDEAVSQALLEAAWSSGVRYYDTAPWYGRGLAEHRLGGFLRTRARKEFSITTKVGRTLVRPKNPRSLDRSPWTGGLNFEVNFDYSYDGIMRSYEQALQRLALDTVDALVIHDLDKTYHTEETFNAHQRDLFTTGMKALEELKAAGDISAFGMGINTAEALETVASEVNLDFALVAMPYTLLTQESLHNGMAACLKRKTSVIIGAPFASGILATGSGENGKYNYLAAPAEVQEKVRRIEAVCSTHKVSLQAAALQFPLAHPAVASIIPGAAKSSEVIQNIASVGTKIPAAFWADLKSAGLIDPHSPVPIG